MLTEQLLGQQLVRQDRDAVLLEEGPAEGSEPGLRGGAFQEVIEQGVEADRGAPVVEPGRGLRGAA